MYVSVNLHKLVSICVNICVNICQYFIRDNFLVGGFGIVSLKRGQKIKPNLKMVKLISYFRSAPTHQLLDLECSGEAKVGAQLCLRHV